MPLVDRAPHLPPPVPGGDGTTAPGPLGVLLQPGGPEPACDATPGPRPPVPPPLVAPAPADPDEALGLDAARLLQLLALRTGVPPRWTAPAFCREVDLVRTHLGPIRSRPILAASFGREAFHGQAAPGSDRALGGSGVRVAYALRWLELTHGHPQPGWRELVDR